MKYLALSAVLAVAPLVARAQQGLYTQCGGIGWGGGTSCVSGSVCTVLNSYYSQCLPGTATSSSSSHSSSSGTSSSPSSTPTSTLPRFGGVNTAGYDFSVATDGSFNGTGVSPPVSQYSHFTQEGANIYRIPFAWQLMTPTLGGTISQTFLSRYDTTVQAALNSGPNVYVILDLHNYARWNGGIIAQGGPTNAQFASIWTQLAQKYGSNQRVIFGLMNEPHDIPSLTTWAQSVQAVVTAIRQAGAQNFLLIPGSSYSSAQMLPTEAGPSLLTVTDPLGGTSRLIFDVHKYLDSDNSGTHPDCTTNNLQVFQTLVTWLQANGRQAILSETGGGNTTSCITMLGQQLSFIQSSYPTILGFTIWAAGAFDTTYVLTVTPNTNGTDQPLWAQAIKQYLP